MQEIILEKVVKKYVYNRPYVKRIKSLKLENLKNLIYWLEQKQKI